MKVTKETADKLNKIESEMRDHEDRMREKSKLEHPSILIFVDGDEQSIDTVVVFADAGDYILDEKRRIRDILANPRLISQIPLPEKFDKESIPYWNHAYIG